MKAWIQALLAAVALFLAGCPQDDDDVADDDSADGAEEHSHAVVIETDFTVGALATINLDDWSVDEQITAVTGDSVVQADRGRVMVINRYQYDSVRIYQPPDLVQPLVEFSTGAGSNPQEALFCDDALFVTRLEEDAIGVYDPDSGLPIGSVDLSDYADADGTPEAATMARIDETLYVGLQRLDRSSDIWVAAPGGGRVIEVDCASRAVTKSWETGPNVMVRRHPVEAGWLLLLEGLYYDEDWSALLDGGIRELDPAEDQPGPILLGEQEVGGNFAEVAATAQGRGILLAAEDEGYRIHCLQIGDWSVEEAEYTASWIPDMAINDRGEVFLAARAWNAPESTGGLVVYDADDCTNLTGENPIQLSLEPFSVAFY